ncbi:MAG TPA: Zn-ribbon domain-containing OB-fold protein [Solirubrobacter sp.]
MHAELLTGTASEPVLLGSECRACGTVSFPRQSACPRCTSTDVTERRLARRGTLWSWTVQRFRPKSPPYTGPEAFEPYGVGYVELPGEVRVEARLTEADPDRLRIGMEMELTLIPEATFAFKPVP